MAFIHWQSNATDYDQTVFFDQLWIECKKVEWYHFV
jgi:hypothetical protein